MMNVKWNIWFLLALGSMVCGLTARADHTVIVAGLVNLTNYQAALLVITDSPPEASFLMTTRKWVTEGQNFDDLYVTAKPAHIEIRGIDFTNDIVRARENGTATFYTPPTTNEMGAFPGRGLLLFNAPFDDVLDIYGNLKGRTLLVHPDIARPPVTLAAAATNRTEVIDILGKAVRERGAAIIADGDKFEWIVPAGATNMVSPQAIPARLPAGSATNPVDTLLPKGGVDFNAAELPQLLAVYQALTARKWSQDKPLPAVGTFVFRNQTPLTKPETLHAFDVLLAWHGIKVVPVNDTSFKLIPLAAGD